MQPGSLKTAAEIANEHGQGLVVVIGGREWVLTQLTVVDHPRDLSLCDGQTPDGDLLLFNAEDVQLVRIQPTPDGKPAAVRGFGSTAR